MNEEIKNKINFISKMLAMYQNTIVKETDTETINLIKKDVAIKQIELETIKADLETELDKLYDNGANEIDSEVNQLQIIINEVDDLIDDVIPDILIYTKTSIQKNTIQKKEEVNLEPKFKIQKEIKVEEKVKEDNEIKNETEKEFEENDEIENEIEVETEEDDEIEDEIEEDDEIEDENEEEIREDDEIEIETEVETEEDDEIEDENEEEIREDDEIEIETEVETEEDDEIENKNEEEIEKQKKIEKNYVENDNVKKFKLEVENIVQKPTSFNIILLNQPSESYRNTATNIVLNRTQNVNSPENAIKKTHNAAEKVMNSIMKQWNGNQQN